MTLPAIGFERQGERPFEDTRSFVTVPSLDAATRKATRRYANGMRVAEVLQVVYPSATTATVVYITCSELWTQSDRVAILCKVERFL